MVGEYAFFLSDEMMIYPGFVYPEAYNIFVKERIPDLQPWDFLWDNEINSVFIGLKQRYPLRRLVPFARRSDNDDIACFDASEVSKDPDVIIIHDFASPGWEIRGKCNDFMCWVDMARSESEEWKQSH